MSSTPLVIIQYSCDPPPYEASQKDTVIDNRLKVDAQGLKNAKRFWLYLKNKQTKKYKTLKKITKEINSDFNRIRQDEKTKYGITQQFFEYYDSYHDQSNPHIKTTKPDLNVKKFVHALKKGHIVYLPLHGGHVLDEGDVKNLNVTLGRNIYVISFNPPNTQALLLNKKPLEEFLNFIANYDALVLLSKPQFRRRVFEQEFYKQMRIWGPDNNIINRGIISDRYYDLRCRYSKTQDYVYMKKTLLRRSSGENISALYNDLSNIMS